MTSVAPSDTKLDAASVHREVLPNGLTVLVREDHSAPVVAIVTYVKAGYFDETDDVVGIAHVLEHMYFKGTTARGVGEISKQTKASGGYLNAGTIYDHTSYYTVLPATGFDAGLDIQADAYADSVIDAGELAKELEVIIQEAKRKSDNPSAVATETLYELLHDRHRMRRWRIGREPGLRALDRDALVGFYRNFYRPANTVLSIVGDVRVAQAMDRVRERYGALADAAITRTPGDAEPQAPHGFRHREWTGDIAQAQVAFGWRGVPTLHADAPLLDVAAAVLGAGRASRLYRAVRERRLATSVSAYHYSPTELGVFAIHLETPRDNAAAAARAAWAQLRALRDGGVRADELERARRTFESRYVRRLESMEGQANFLAEWEALGAVSLGERYHERQMTATADDVTGAIRRYLVPDETSVVVYRPDGTSEVAADAAAMRRVLDAAVPEALPPTPLTEPALPAPSLARFEREEGGVRVYRTERGVPVLVRHKPGAAVAYAGVYALGGPSDEGDARAGLTNVMLRAALKGTARRTAEQVAVDAELLGGSVVPTLMTESFGWMISVPTTRLDAALELLADVVQTPRFADEAVATERAVALTEVAALRDDMYRYPVRLATGAAFAGHPYGAPSGGTEASLGGMARDDVAEWHARRVLRGPTVVVLVGDFDDDRAAATAAARFDRLTAGEGTTVPAPEWPAETRVAVERREKAQTALALAYRGPSRRDDARWAAAILAGVASGLGGRFFDELRDRQSLAYTVHAYASERRTAGMFVAYIATGPDKEDVARAGLLREFARLRDEPVRADELAQAQTYAVGSHAIRQESGAAQLSEVVDAWLFGSLGDLDEFDARVLAVTADDILAMARRYFDDDARVEGIVRGTARTV